MKFGRILLVSLAVLALAGMTTGAASGKGTKKAAPDPYKAYERTAVYCEGFTSGLAEGYTKASGSSNFGAGVEIQESFRKAVKEKLEALSTNTDMPTTYISYADHAPDVGPFELPKLLKQGQKEGVNMVLTHDIDAAAHTYAKCNEAADAMHKKLGF